MVTIRKYRQQALEFDVQRYEQGGRTAYSLVMDLGTLDDTLPHFVNPERIDKANRRFIPSHSRKIAEYIYDLDDWVLGAILLGIDPSAVEFIAYSDGAGEPSESLGYIRIPLNGGTSTIQILDGQHRRMAVRTVRARLRQEILEKNKAATSSGGGLALDRLQQKNALLNEMSIPVVLYEEADTKKLRRMFRDLAETKNIDAATKTRFDDRDPFNRAAVELVELGRSHLLANRVEMERTIVGRRSNDLLAVNQLARCLKVLKYGYGGRASRERIREAQYHYGELVDAGIAWADEFLPSARKEYEELMSIELEEDFVLNNRSRFVAYRASILQLMAGCLYATSEIGLPREDLARWIRQADFDLESDTCIFLETGLLIHGDTSLRSRKQYIQKTIEYIVQQAKADLG